MELPPPPPPVLLSSPATIPTSHPEGAFKPFIIYSTPLMLPHAMAHSLLICTRFCVSYTPSDRVFVCACAVFMYVDATSYPSEFLKPCFPQAFSFLLHSCSTVAHFGGLTCTDSCHACSLSAIHLVQSLMGSHRVNLYLLCVSLPPPFFFYFLSSLVFILASHFLF